MRRPRKQRCKKSRRYPRGEKFFGAVEYRGVQRWAGTFATETEWRDAAFMVEGDLREEVDRLRGRGRRPRRVPTVSEFLGVEVRDDGRVVPRAVGGEIWPWTRPRGTTKDSSRRTYAENIRAFAREHGDRKVDSFDRPEALEIVKGLSNGQKAVVRRLFSDLFDAGLVSSNPFVRVSVKQRSRLEREGAGIRAAPVLSDRWASFAESC